MSKKLLLCYAILLAFASMACAEPSWWGYHGSIAELTNGKSNYSNARFYASFIHVEDDDVNATDEHMELEGTLTLSGGNYSLLRDGELQEVSGTQQTLPLRAVMEPGETLEFNPFIEHDEVYFLAEADGGLNGVNVSWTFPSMPSLNGQATLPNYKTTAEQLEEYVPYIEYIRDGSNVTGFTWRIVNPSSPDTAIEPRDFEMRFRMYDVRDHMNNRLYKGNWQTIAKGEVPEGTIMLDEPVDEASIWYVVTRLRTSENGWDPFTMYQWIFLTGGGRALEPDIAHVSHAPLVNGKPDYENAEFSFIEAYLKAEMVFLETAHFAGEGKLEVPGGGYVLNTGDEEPAEVPAGTDTATYPLKMTPYISSIMSRYMEYFPADNQGRTFNFTGGAEENLPGKTLKWTFPEELDMDGEAVIPEFMTTKAQLTDGAPYIEITSEDGKITKIDYKLVNAQTMEEVKPAYDTEFMMQVYKNEDGEFPGMEVEGSSGTWELEEPIPLSIVTNITAEVRRFENDEPVLYRWDFIPAEAGKPASQDVTSPDSQPVAVTDIAILNTVQGLELAGANDVFYLPSSASGGIRTTLTAEERAAIPATENVATVLPQMSVKKTAVYVWGADLPSDLTEGTSIFLRMTVEDNVRTGIKASDGEASYMFFDDSGKEIHTVPKDHHVNIAAYLEANKTYSPVITTTKASSDSEKPASQDVTSPDSQPVAVTDIAILNTVQGLGWVGSNEVFYLPPSASGGERTTPTVREWAEIPATEQFATALPQMSVKKTAVYVWSADLPNSLTEGASIFLHMTSEDNVRTRIKASDGEASYIFFDDSGNEIHTVPKNHHINIAAYLEANKTYSPVITTTKASSNSSLGSSGGGCSSGFSLLSLAVLGLLVKRRNAK